MTTMEATPTSGSKPTAKGQTERLLGERFRSVRRSRKVWLLDLSKALNVSVNTIRWHEAGARMMRSDLIVRAAEVLNVTPDDLLLIEGGVHQTGDSHGNATHA